MRVDTVGYPMPLNIDRPEWVESAACYGIGWDLFFPDRPDAKKSIAKAKKICDGCPVIGPCLEYALETNSPGIWAGTGPRERQSILDRRMTHPNARFRSPDERINK